MNDPVSTMSGGPEEEPRPTPRALHVGEVLDGHELLQEVARGGMGVVYRARELRSGRVVALKTVLWPEDEDDLRRFEVETTAVSQLDHPGIVPVYHVGECERVPYFTMKYVEGGTLHDLPKLKRDPARCVELMISVAEAVQYAHDRAILHRDLKPANILLDGEAPRIVDFGLACRLDVGQRWTVGGALIGTAGYMAPEQASGEARLATVATDVYGLGAVLYHLLTGGPPFRGETLPETLRMISHDDPPDLALQNPRVDRDLVAICLRCLEKSPARRYDSAEQLARDLRCWRQGLPVAARPLPKYLKLWRHARRRPLRVAALLGLGLAPLVLVLAAFWHISSLTREHGRAVATRDQILASNQFSARLAASVIGWRLRQLGEPVLAAAKHTDLAALMQAGGRPALVRWLEARCGEIYEDLAEFEASPYETWTIYDEQGAMLARWPERPGAGHRPRPAEPRRRAGLFVSPVYRPEGVDADRYGLCVPIVRGERRYGLLVAEMGGGLLGLPSEHDEARKTALAARLEGGGVRLIAHGAYRPGRAPLDLDPSYFAEVDDSAAVPRYADPAGGGYEGRWLAAIAPVHGTPFFAIIQERFEDDDVSQRALKQGQALWRLVALLALLVLGIAALLAWPRQS